MALKNYILFLLFGLLLSPAIVLAKSAADSLNGSSLALFQQSTYSLMNAKKTPSTNFAGLSNTSGKNAKKVWFKAMRYSGNARFYPYYRNMSKAYDIPSTNISGLTLPVNLTADDGSLQPLMLFRLEGNPSAKTWFQTELQFANLLNRTTTLTDPTGKLANLFVIFQLQAAVDTKIGHLKMIAGGGVNWYRLSPSTLWGYQYRDDLFERYPWDPEGMDFSRYNSAYAVGDIPRDQRFGMQGTQGFILEATKMPKGFDASILYGKVSTGGGFTSFVTGTPLNMLAGRIGKVFGSHKIGFSYFDQFGYTTNKVDYKAIVRGADTCYVEDNRVSQLVTSMDARFEFNDFSFFTELGGGSYLSNTYNLGLQDGAKAGVENVSLYKRQWGETMFFEINTKKRLTYLPLKLSFYRISGAVVNNASSVVNTSVEQAKPSTDTPDQYYTNYYDGLVTDVGQLANNRQGINLSTSKNFKKLMVKLDYGIAQEIVNLAGDMRNGARGVAVTGSHVDSVILPYTNSITFEHKLNGITNSRFAPYQRFTGPYQRGHSVFRRTFENIAITDKVVNYNKSFNTINLELKYKFKFLGKDLIVTNFNTYSSVQDHASAIPIFTDQAFLRIYYSELMGFYGIHPKVTLLGFGGIERVLGNNRTELTKPNGKATDQSNYGYGVGVDYNFHSRASLHWRGRWFSHQDKNFILDTFQGFESTMEFKVFF